MHTAGHVKQERCFEVQCEIHFSTLHEFVEGTSGGLTCQNTTFWAIQNYANKTKKVVMRNECEFCQSCYNSRMVHANAQVWIGVENDEFISIFIHARWFYSCLIFSTMLWFLFESIPQNTHVVLGTIWVETRKWLGSSVHVGGIYVQYLIPLDPAFECSISSEPVHAKKDCIFSCTVRISTWCNLLFQFKKAYPGIYL